MVEHCASFSAGEGRAWIHVRGLRAFVRLGNGSAERAVGHNLTVDLSIAIPWLNTNDCLDNTIDYGAVAMNLVSIMEDMGEVLLFEYLAEQTIKELRLRHPNLTKIRLAITKAFLPIPHCQGCSTFECESDV